MPGYNHRHTSSVQNIVDTSTIQNCTYQDVILILNYCLTQHKNEPIKLLNKNQNSIN